MLSNWTLWWNSNLSEIALGFLTLILSIVLFDRVFKLILQSLIRRISQKREAFIYTFLKDEKLVFWILSLPYLTILHQGTKWIPGLPEWFITLADRLVLSLYVLFGLFIFSHILRVINQIYNRSAISRMRPIKGYLQSIQIITYIAGFVCMLSILLDKSPLIFISGLGAMTAVLLLVFKDTILSFVAGVQLTANDLLRVGDWVEMPQFNADGDVIEVALNTVKIQNWDKTFTVIPAHKFLENSFRNWRGMQESGGRRIKRSLFIDLNTIRFLNQKDIDHLSQVRVLRSYLKDKLQELDGYNGKLSPDELALENVNFRKLTNVGTFRAYISEYLRSHPQIHKNLTFLVRQLAPCAQGLPIEIYVFTNDTRWAIYESIQSDIFDHLYSVMQEFDLQPYQSPSGQDLKGIKLES